MKRRHGFCTWTILSVGCLLTCLRVVGLTDTVTLLYTSDMHDHLRAAANGVGGVPYVSGYVKQVRSQRTDVVLVDAGDVVNKGDYLPFHTRGKTMYDAMGRIGYSAAAPGNHGFVYGLPQLLENTKDTAFPFVCANVRKNDGAPFPMKPSTILDADGVKVGVIGFTLPGAAFGKAGCKALDLNGTAAALKKEAEILAQQVHLIVAVGHFPNPKCQKLSALVPAIDIFVAAHSHQLLPQPKTVAATGALIVQAGSNALYVGHLELTVDLDTRKIVSHKNNLVKLVHNSVPEDEDMSRWISETEKALLPEAQEILGTAGEAIPRNRIGKLYARAIRQKAEADIALVNPKRLLNGFVAGQSIDTNAVFATYMMATPEVVVLDVSGADLIRGLGRFKNSKTTPAWDGFAGRLDPGSPVGQRLLDHDLTPERVYSVAITDGMTRPASLPRTFGFKAPKGTARPCDFTPVDALCSYIKDLTASGAQVRATP
ncbi:MAG: bifunctional metallophosphatase/5'-nucleotidase [Lentisphaerae bacterium]|jgi:2',3'-cyclic-nucleotide 2'-phosphodiesterase (5'-nucleotidase family)|nr:bifunctional metallophosphatase/5'-nucleotidase [Lentisphaerota bacterium]MBT4815377.1 bifunctional metallophosphatase/5'-nucleotidase [Lentisphaerota bacterium]MBT5605274.1 bifunctional metallophosphatase/5'-nucleotidase [Lentisphaerota bacterium]MBT7057741.1 bifunctional metallophosphatase/5'-nucleotidase [Lentisphaerota bacterium]MBT7844608.1 bifunctional metallophosphatase/5'-nucleotidase [Lentisphaerota bacterium]